MALVDLKIAPEYDGFLFLAEAMRNPPMLPRHRHVELELNLIVRGRITCVVEGRRYDFPRGTLVWFFPAQVHQLVDRSSDAQYYVGVFKPSMLRDVCTQPAYAALRKRRPQQPGVLSAVLDAPGFDLLHRAMDATLEGSLSPDILNREGGYGAFSHFTYRHADRDGLNAGLGFLLLHAWRLSNRGGISFSSGHLHPGVRRALGLLAEPDFGGGLSELARACGVSAPYLSRLFAGELGVPLSKYRNSVRLGRFLAHYQTNPRAGLLEAVLAAGFGSYSQFHKVFVQSFGSPPRQLLANSRPGRGRGRLDGN